MHPIKDYYLTGDLHSAALVSKSCSLDWLCFPNFDSPSIFGSLLDKDGGTFKVEMSDYSVEHNYVENTGIIEFRFKGKMGNFIFTILWFPRKLRIAITIFLLEN